MERNIYICCFLLNIEKNKFFASTSSDDIFGNEQDVQKNISRVNICVTHVRVDSDYFYAWIIAIDRMYTFDDLKNIHDIHIYIIKVYTLVLFKRPWVFYQLM